MRDYLYRFFIGSACIRVFMANDGPKGYNDVGTAVVFALLAIALRKERP
jgi:hypothetical protein